MYDIAVIGASGFLGRNLVKILQHRGLRVLRVTSQLACANHIDTVIWTYDTPPPALIKECRSWINCAFNLSSGFDNLEIIRKLLSERNGQRFIQVSTNAALSYDGASTQKVMPRRRGGEDYARIKGAIDAHIEQMLPAGSYSIAYPTIVIGPGADWAQTISYIASHDQIFLKAAGETKVDWVHIDDVVKALSDLVELEILPPQLVLRSSLEKKWKTLILEHVPLNHMPEFKELKSNRPFFDNFGLDLIFRVLASPFVPSRVAVWLFRLARYISSSRRLDDPGSKKSFTPTGPTRYYMGRSS